MDDPIVNVEHENEAEDKILKDLKMSGVVNEDFHAVRSFHKGINPGEY